MFDKKYKRALAIIESKRNYYLDLRDQTLEEAKSCDNHLTKKCYIEFAQGCHERQMALAMVQDILERELGK